MIKASVSGLKNSLSEYLRKVRAGQSVVIYDRKIPIARIERIESSGSDSDRMTRLRAEGITRPPTKPLRGKQLAAALAVIPQRGRVLDALLAERAEDR
jgi:antitoxin (DNA-binding transcriptional repressor) of toxin-antitoxin stability system